MMIAVARAKAISEGLLYRFRSFPMAKSPNTTPVFEKIAMKRVKGTLSLPKIINMMKEVPLEKTIMYRQVEALTSA